MNQLRLLPLSLLCCLLLSLGLTACRYSLPDIDDEHLSATARDSLACLYRYHYTLGANMEVCADSVPIACLPVKDCYSMLHKADRVVVAEFAIHPQDSIDSVWVKVAHTQEIQGWIRGQELRRNFIPDDSISQAIHLFSDTHISYSIAVVALFIVAWLLRVFHKRQLQLVYFNDIDSFYPALLCLLVACSATVYESIQLFAPDTWQHFYFNPTLSPCKVSFILSLFLCTLWGCLIVVLAVLDDLFRLLSPAAALCYLLGLASCCIFCYFFFIFTTQFYVGYLFLSLFIGFFFKRLHRSLSTSRYLCGHCGQKLEHKGVCPHCGAMNR